MAAIPDDVKLALWQQELKYAEAEEAKRHAEWAKAHSSSDMPLRQVTWDAWRAAQAESAKFRKWIQDYQRSQQHAANSASLDLAKAVAVWEGGRSPDGLFHAYWDSTGRVWTIGYGHTFADGPPIPGPNSAPLTGPQAILLLLHDINRIYAPAVANYCKQYGFKPSQKQFDALTSFVYNVGTGTLGTVHTIGQALQRHDVQGVANAFGLYDMSGGHVLAGLVRRRNWERQLWLGGTYTVS